jgi:hypothetical protein
VDNSTRRPGPEDTVRNIDSNILSQYIFVVCVEGCPSNDSDHVFHKSLDHLRRHSSVGGHYYFSTSPKFDGVNLQSVPK